MPNKRLTRIRCIGRAICRVGCICAAPQRHHSDYTSQGQSPPHCTSQAHLVVCLFVNLGGREGAGRVKGGWREGLVVLNQPIHNVNCKHVVPILFHLLFCGPLLSFLLKHTTLHTLDISWPLCFILAFVLLIFWRACSTITVGLMWSSKQSTPTVTTTPGVEGACCSCQCKANRCHKTAPPPPPPPDMS